MYSNVFIIILWTEFGTAEARRFKRALGMRTLPIRKKERLVERKPVTYQKIFIILNLLFILPNFLFAYTVHSFS